MSDESSVEASNETASTTTSAGVGLADDVLIPILAEYLPHQRWFSAKGQELGSIEIIGRAVAARDLHGSDVEQVLFTVETLFGQQRYQLWIGWSWHLPDRLAHATIGSGWGRVAYDALQDQNVATLLIKAIAENTDFGDVRARAEPDAVIDTRAPGLVIGAEQSNTSIVYGHTAILKVFRRLEPGPNPDAEIHRALHAVGSTHIAQPLGVITGPVQGEDTTLGLLTEFFANSADGWAMATSSVRDLMSEGDLARAFGTTVAHHSELSKILDQMVTDAEVAISLVPELGEHRDAILATFARAGDHAAGLNVQRIHGDLHLGQVLRTLNGWSIIDFEGEPSKPLAYRRALHSPLKDIAGMLRSFDYAARGLVISPHTDAQHKYRAAEWAERNRRAFSDGYASVAGNDPRQAGSLLRAFELDKALYEVVYEHGHRPLWVAIPMQAVVALINAGGIS